MSENEKVKEVEEVEEVEEVQVFDENVIVQEADEFDKKANDLPKRTKPKAKTQRQQKKEIPKIRKNIAPSLILYTIIFYFVILPGLYLGIQHYRTPKGWPTWDQSELSFKNPSDNQYYKFPSLEEDPATVFLSIIVPALNEEKRLPKMFQDAYRYLEEKEKIDPEFTWEIIFVDDYSTDKTRDVIMKLAEEHTTNKIRLLPLAKWCGKGCALQKGMLKARGKYLLIADADGASKMHDLDRLLAKMKEIETEGFGIALGSRTQTDAVAERSVIRKFLMDAFHMLVSMVVHHIEDTQCGFKLFSREAAKQIMPNIKIRGFAMDVEMLYIAQHIYINDFTSNYYKKNTHIPIAEVGIVWNEIPGSKVNLLKSSIKMGFDIINIKLNYLFDIWEINLIKDQSRIVKEKIEKEIEIDKEIENGDEIKEEIDDKERVKEENEQDLNQNNNSNEKEKGEEEKEIEERKVEKEQEKVIKNEKKGEI
ncbi:dolichyl-phosphate beta-glucosyltransferase [Anaeramoeba flamelloides]|uniref:dolichyl-phosphate beta-glucosyltransferase n=1 Tax=Anaeramoeba flamelloides TaxID=1746091 RepID=A0AAV7ZCH1_9EUKA|nr:dolichyl-phosphate beta-glucosyltransferase [Anaeramoeba flamelloides]